MVTPNSVASQSLRTGTRHGFWLGLRTSRPKLNGGILDFDPDRVTIDAGEFLNATEKGYFAVSQSGNDLTLHYIPEPRLYGLALGMSATVLIIRRRLTGKRSAPQAPGI